MIHNCINRIIYLKILKKNLAKKYASREFINLVCICTMHYKLKNTNIKYIIKETIFNINSKNITISKIIKI